jgi:membrane associated rhomboid family serine protease
MRAALRIAGRMALWALVVLGVLAIALFVAVFVTTDRPNERTGIAVLTIVALAIVAWAVYRLRRRPRPREEPAKVVLRAHEQLRAGEPIVLTPSRRRWTLLLVLSLALTGICAWTLAVTPHVLGVLGVVFFGAGIVLSVLQLVPGQAYLRIAADGLASRQPLRTSRWEWNDIENFTAYEIHHRGGSTKQVGFDLRNLTPDRQGFWKTVARGMVGVDVALPDTYGMDHHDLAALLADARDRYATEHGLSPSARADLALAQQAERVRRDRVPAVTVVLVLACIAAFAVEAGRFGPFPSAQELIDAGGASRDALADGRWWTLCSANLLHGNPIHLIFNLAGLGIIGILLEREVGWARFALACLAGGIAAMGLAVLVPQGSVVVGASGIVFAISGWAVLRDTHRTRALGAIAWATLPVGLIYTFLTPHVSIGAHLGGLLGGLAVGYAFERGHSRGLTSQAA